MFMPHTHSIGHSDTITGTNTKSERISVKW